MLKLYDLFFTFSRRLRAKFTDIEMRKTSSLDPKRAVQSNAEVAKGLESMVDGVLARLYTEGTLKELYTLKTFPLNLKYNMDEVAVNPDLMRVKQFFTKDSEVRTLFTISFVLYILRSDPRPFNEIGIPVARRKNQVSCQTAQRRLQKAGLSDDGR
jgi:hypothetical protein